MTAFSGSVEGSSGRVSSPAPRALRLLLEREVRRLDVRPARLMGDDPVARLTPLALFGVRDGGPATGAVTALAMEVFGSACPQTSQ
jgi:hypothetical protein